MQSEGILLNLFLPRTRGACVAHFRNLLHLTQIDISRELGIDRSSISKMENGDVNVSESVWNHVLELVYYDFGLEHLVSFIEFQQALELCLEDDGRRSKWIERKLSWQPATSI